MKNLFVVMCCTVAFLAATSGCSQKPEEQKPKACPTCNGMGSITQAEQIPLPYEIISRQLRNEGEFNPDYFADVMVENKGDEDGTFTVLVDFIYINPTITHTESGDVFIKAHSQAMKTIHYDADHLIDTAKCRVNPPQIIHSTKIICPTCAGAGMIK